MHPYLCRVPYFHRDDDDTAERDNEWDALCDECDEWKAVGVRCGEVSHREWYPRSGG